MAAEAHVKNPRRVAAGRINGLKRRPWTVEDRQRLRIRALETKPWRFSTGPRTAEGKMRATANGRNQLPDPKSKRQAMAGIADVNEMIRMMAGLRSGLQL